MSCALDIQDGLRRLAGAPELPAKRRIEIAAERCGLGFWRVWNIWNGKVPDRCVRPEELNAVREALGLNRTRAMREVLDAAGELEAAAQRLALADPEGFRTIAHTARLLAERARALDG